MGLMGQAAEAAAALQRPDTWQLLADAAVQRADVRLALRRGTPEEVLACLMVGLAAWCAVLLNTSECSRCYRAAGDVAAAQALERVQWMEERQLLAGHLHSLVMGDHDRAEVHLPISSL